MLWQVYSSRISSGEVFFSVAATLRATPGPNLPQTRESMKQTRLTSAGSSGRRARAEQSTTTSQHEKDATIADVMSVIQSFKTSMDTRFDDTKQDMQNLQEDYVAMQGELKGLREDVCDLRDQNHDLQRENRYLTDRVKELERKTDDLEGQSKHSNLLFYGVPRKENETSAECERLVKDIVTDKLELSPDIDFDRVHRVNSKPDSPINRHVSKDALEGASLHMNTPALTALVFYVASLFK